MPAVPPSEPFRFVPLGAGAVSAAGPHSVWRRFGVHESVRPPAASFRPKLGGAALQTELTRVARARLYASAVEAASNTAGPSPSRRAVVSLLTRKRDRLVVESLSSCTEFRAGDQSRHTTFSVVSAWSALTVALAHADGRLSESRLQAAHSRQGELQELLADMHPDASGRCFGPAPAEDGPDLGHMLAFAATVGRTPLRVSGLSVPWQEVDRTIAAALADSTWRWQRATAEVPTVLAATSYETLQAAEALLAAAPWVPYSAAAGAVAQKAVAALGPALAEFAVRPDVAGQAHLPKAMTVVGHRIGAALVGSAAEPGRRVVPALQRLRPLRHVPLARLN